MLNQGTPQPLSNSNVHHSDHTPVKALLRLIKYLTY